MSFFSIAFPICAVIAVASYATAITKSVKTLKQLREAKGKRKNPLQVRRDLKKLNQLLDEYYS